MDELILKEREFKNKLVEIINDSKLPAFILRLIIKDILEQLNTLDQQQYQEALRKQAEEKDGKEEK